MSEMVEEPVYTVEATPGRERVELAGSFDCRLTPSAQDGSGGRRVYRAVLIRPGEWQGKGIWCAPEVLARSAPLFNGLASFLNPPGPSVGQHGYPGLELLLGVTENARWDEEAQAIVADYRLADTDTARWFQRLVDGWLRDRAAGRPVPAVGLSAVPWVMLQAGTSGSLREVVDIVSVDQVDAVYRPAAGGEFVQVLAAAGVGAEMEGFVAVGSLPAADESCGFADLEVSGEGEDMHE